MTKLRTGIPKRTPQDTLKLRHANPSKRPKGQQYSTKVSRQIDKMGIFEKYNLTEIDKDILKYKLKYPQVTQSELAVLVGTTPHLVGRTLRKPDARQLLYEFEGDWINKMEKAKDKAVNNLIKLLDHADPKIRIRAIEDVLGIGKTTLIPAGATDLEKLLLQLQQKRQALVPVVTVTEVIEPAKLLPEHEPVEIKQHEHEEDQEKANSSPIHGREL